MKKLFILLFVIIVTQVKAQHVLVLQPHFTKSTDCFIQYVTPSCAPSGYAHIADSPRYNNVPVIHYMAWTFGGCVGYTRSLLRFKDIKNTSLLPAGKNIISAWLTLFSPSTNLTGDAGNSSYNGTPYSSNPGWCYETADSFDAQTVSWNTQPSVKHADSVAIRTSYLHWGDSDQIIYCTSMVRDMYTNINTGFKLVLQTESYYRQRLFASGRFPDSTLHPMLTIIWGPPVTVHDSTSCKKAWFTAGADTSVALYKWYFGDGSSDTGRIVSHNYNSFGTFYAKLALVYHVGVTDTLRDTVLIANTAGVIKYNFSDSTITCKTKVFRALHTSGHFATSYLWLPGDATTDSTSTVTHTYALKGTYNVKLIVNDSMGCADTSTRSILIDSAVLNYHIGDSLTNCKTLQLNGLITSGDTAKYFRWSFGDGSSDTLNPVSHTYSAKGAYVVKLVYTNISRCVTDSITDTVTINTPNFHQSIKDSIYNCKTVKFDAIYVSGDTPRNYIWRFGDGGTSTSIPVIHTYSGVGTYNIKLLMSDTTKCTDSIAGTLTLKLPNFHYNITDSVLNCVTAIYTASITTGDTAASLLWRLGDGTTGTTNPITHTYTKHGSYNITIIASDINGCSDSFTHTATVDMPIKITAGPDTTVCQNTSLQLWVIGGSTYIWSPITDLDDATSPTPIASVKGSTMFIVTGTDATGCSGIDTVQVSVYNNPVIKAGSDGKKLTCINISSQLSATGGVAYAWTPADGLNDAQSATPVASPHTTTTYTVTGTDINGCKGSDMVTVYSDDCYTIGVPGGFSPNGDGKNDILYVRGTNIKTITFTIYNRWGQRIFESNDMNIGWDGTFNGMPQPVETYAYSVEAYSYSGTRILKQGSFTLLR